MSIPELFFGSASAATLFQVGSGYSDDGEDYTAKVQSNPILPGGPEGQAIFPAVYLSLRHRVEPESGAAEETVEVTVVAVVDEEDAATSTFTVTMTPITDDQDPPATVRKVYEVAFSVPHLRNGVEKGRKPPTGTALAVRIEWPGTDIRFAGGKAEYKLTRESRSTAS